jgi:hypothetical protein
MVHMKKIILSLLVAVAFCLSVFAVSPTPKGTHSHNFTIINIHDLTDDVFLDELIQGKHPDIVIEVPAYTTLPYSLIFGFGHFVEFKGNIKDRMANENTFETDGDAYLRYIRGEVLVSENLTDWETTVNLFWQGVKAGLIELCIPAKAS